MFDQVWQRLDNGARLSVPFISAFLCVLLSVITWPLPHLGSVAPPLALMAVYYWAVHRPDLFGAGLAFVIGLINDVVNFLPIGLSALLFVALHQLILHQRRFFVGHSFFMMWSGFAITVPLVMLVEWIMLCLIRWQMFPTMPIIIQTVLAVVFFPLPCWLFIWLQRLVLTND